MGSRRLKMSLSIGIRWFGPLASRAKSREAIPGLSAEQPRSNPTTPTKTLQNQSVRGSILGCFQK